MKKNYKQIFLVQTEMPKGFNSSLIQIALVGMMIKVIKVTGVIETESRKSASLEGKEGV